MERTMNELFERIAAAVGWDLDVETLDLELTDEEVARDLDYGREDVSVIAEPVPAALH